jgi:hypothetical protein
MATSPRPWNNNDYIKNAKSDNAFKKGKTMVLAKDISQAKREKIILWNTFFRRNMHRFCETALGVKLFPYQVIWFYLMSISDVFVSICARAAAKSFLVACYTCCKAILYPGSEILISASTIKQASLIVSSKITMLRDMSPLLQREITSITSNNNSNVCLFSNGSSIKVVASNEGSRGNRATTLLMDEFLLLKKEVVDAILLPFLYVRQAPFMNALEYPEYADYPQEEPQVISISSAGFKSDWGFKYVVSVIKMMVEGKKAGFFAVDYLVSIKSGIKTKSQIESERRNSDPDTFSREYENIFSGESGRSYFKSSMFDRKIKKAFYPMRNDMFHLKKNPYSIPKIEGELRVIGYDVAARLNKMNDNSVLTAIRCLPTHKGYQRQVVYIESSHGSNVVSQGLRLKDVFFEFEADHLILDIAQNGIGLFDNMSSISRNDEKGIEYPAFTVMEHYSLDEAIKTELRERTLGVNALPVVYPISATSKLNSEIAVALRSALQKKLFSFLVNDTEAEDYLTRTNKEFLETKDDLSLRPWFLHPFTQTNLLLMECLNLEMILNNNLIKLSEGSGRKDRYTSLSYANYFITEVLDRQLLREENNNDSEWDIISSLTMFV